MVWNSPSVLPCSSMIIQSHFVEPLSATKIFKFSRFLVKKNPNNERGYYSRSTKSATRVAYPASLSYQPKTFTVFPMDRVRSESKMQLCGFPTISTETNGSVEYSRIPFIGPSAASFIALFTSSAVTSRLRTAVKSVTEPVGVGTRMANPSNFQANCGKTKPTAFAAPVDVGIIDKAAALALRKSLCGESWSR